MGAVAPDADVLIGFLDGRDAQHRRAVGALRPFLEPGHRLVIGASVYSEVLVRPLAQGRGEVVRDFVRASGARIAPVDHAVARRAAGLRAEHRSLRLPDALVLAGAIEAGADLLTFDEGLRLLAGRISSP